MPDITIDKLHAAAILPLGIAEFTAARLNADAADDPEGWYYEAEHMAADVARIAIYDEDGKKVGYL